MQKLALFWVTKPHEAYVSERQWGETEEPSHSFHTYFTVWSKSLNENNTLTNEKKAKLRVYV